MRYKLALILAGAAALSACGGGEGNESTPVNAAGSGAATAGGGETAKPQGTLLERLGQTGEHGTLVNAVRAAGLTETLSGAQPYTVFAPTDAAFEKLPAGRANDLLAPDAKGQLVALLTGHIVPGVITTQDLIRAIERGGGKAELATVGGTKLSFSRDGDALVVAGSEGARARLSAGTALQTNGVVHSLDTVLAAT